MLPAPTWAACKDLAPANAVQCALFHVDAVAAHAVQLQSQAACKVACLAKAANLARTAIVLPGNNAFYPLRKLHSGCQTSADSFLAAFVVTWWNINATTLAAGGW